MSQLVDDTAVRQREGSVPDYVSGLPAHWTIKRMKHVSCKVGSGKTPSGGATTYLDDGVMLLRSQNIHDDGLRLDDVAFISEATHAEMAGTRDQAGDVLLNITGASIGRCALCPEDLPEANVNQHVCIIRPASIVPGFLHAVFCSHGVKSLIAAEENGTSREGLNFQQVRGIRLPLPPPREQEAIVRWIRTRTARIDALVEKKRRQIELLHEKRAALISHAVTKGLDPNAPMKDSGIDWLGQVPAQWQHRKLGYLVTMEGGCTPSKSNPEYWIGDIPWVSPKDMKTRVVSESEDHVSEDAVRESSLRLLDPPAVLMVVRGMILAHTFPVALTAVPVTINQDMKALRPKPGCAAQYLAHLLEGISSLILSLVEESAHGTKCLRTEIWKGINLFLPSPAEQADICEELDRHNERLSLLVGRIGRSIDRLREYRTALISAAVTGKIDVRQEVA